MGEQGPYQQRTSVVVSVIVGALALFVHCGVLDKFGPPMCYFRAGIIGALEICFFEGCSTLALGMAVGFTFFDDC